MCILAAASPMISTALDLASIVGSIAFPATVICCAKRVHYISRWLTLLPRGVVYNRNVSELVKDESESFCLKF